MVARQDATKLPGIARQTASDLHLIGRRAMDKLIGTYRVNAHALTGGREAGAAQEAAGTAA
jgi:hypothetical protein